MKRASDCAEEARPLEPSKRVDAAIESLFTVLREIDLDLKDERYGHSIIQERKEFLERVVTGLEVSRSILLRELSQVKRQNAMLTLTNKEFEAEIRRLNEKVERYKEGAATNALRSSEYGNLEKRYNELTKNNVRLEEQLEKIRNAACD